MTLIAALQEHREECAGPAFVADRGAVDMLAYRRWVARHHDRPIDNELLDVVTRRAGRWLARNPYDLVVYFDELRGVRGEKLRSDEPEFVRGLAHDFDVVLQDLSAPVLRTPRRATASTLWRSIEAAL